MRLTTIILLNEHNDKVASKYVCWYPYASVAHSLNQGSFFLYRKTVDMETHKWSKCQVYGVFSYNGNHHITLPLIKALEKL